MRLVVLVALLLCSTAFAKKSAPATPPQASAATKPTHVARAEMFEGQVINTQAAQFQIEQQKLQARIADYQARLKAQYSVDFAAGDQVNFETGVITWHVEKKAVVTGADAGTYSVPAGKP